MYGWENAGLMSPWANAWGGAWGAQPQTIADTVVREQVATALGVEGTSSGYATPGNPNAATQTSQATKDRVRDSLGGSVGRAVGKGALNATIGSALGMPSGMIGGALASGIASPSSVGGVLGGALNAALGTQPQGFISKAIANFAVPAAAGFIGGPVGGLLGGLVGGPVADAIADGLDMRSREDVRDDYENQAGYFGGRTAYADREDAEKAAAKVRSDLPNSMAAIHAMEQAIAASRAIEHARGITASYGMEPGGRSAGKSYGGWGSPGGPSVNGARAVDSAYGPSMGGWGGLGIGNPSSYGGGSRDSSDRGGFGDNDGNSDTAGNAGYGR